MAGLSAQRAVEGKSNEITAIPELLDMLNLKGAIVTIDAMGTQKEIARRIVDKGADYVLALKGNQTSLHADAALFFADPVCAATCAREAETDAGHGRIEERLCRAADASWLVERHPEWKGLRSFAAVTARADRQKERRRKLRDEVLCQLARTRPESHPRQRARPLGRRKQSPLDNGRDFRRRPLPNPKRSFASQPGGHPPHRLQYLKGRQKPPDRSDENASEPASTQNSGPTFSLLNDLGLCPGSGVGCR